MAALNSAINGLTSLLQYITSLNNNNIQDLVTLGEGSHVDEELDDEELARFLFAQEAASLLNVTLDHRSGSSDPADGTLFQQLMAMEEMARSDREMALALEEEDEEEDEEEEEEERPPPIHMGRRPAMTGSPVSPLAHLWYASIFRTHHFLVLNSSAPQEPVIRP